MEFHQMRQSYQMRALVRKLPLIFIGKMAHVKTIWIYQDIVFFYLDLMAG